MESILNFLFDNYVWVLIIGLIIIITLIGFIVDTKKKQKKLENISKDNIETNLEQINVNNAVTSSNTSNQNVVEPANIEPVQENIINNPMPDNTLNQNVVEPTNIESVQENIISNPMPDNTLNQNIVEPANIEPVQENFISNPMPDNTLNQNIVEPTNIEQIQDNISTNIFPEQINVQPSTYEPTDIIVEEIQTQNVPNNWEPTMKTDNN